MWKKSIEARMNKKGFTLMEVLAVLLILAVVVSFAMPGIRFIRDEVQYTQAKNAAVKMADAMRSYYRDSKGVRVKGTLEGKKAAGSLNQSVSEVVAEGKCTVVNTGIPNYTANGRDAIKQLFTCDYLSPKDFVGLPYQFNASDALYEDNILVRAIGMEGARRHSSEGWCVYRDASVTECK